jgi:DNA end-binding protein Ku
MAALERTLANAKAGRDIRAQEEDGDLGDLSKEELEERAKEEGIRGRTKMSKKELVAALSERD